MDFSLTKAQQNIVAKASVVAKEFLEPRAAYYDEVASHPIDSWKDLWRQGFLSISVPREHGGQELDMLTYIMVVERLAQGCTNSAMTLHMHSTVQRYIDALASLNQKTRYYSEVVEEGLLFGSWGSEPGRRGGAGTVGTIIVPVKEGFSISGDKHFCTMAGGAHRYMVHCSRESDDGARSLLMALVPNNASGLEIHSGWDTLGMRATVSPKVSFNECFVDENAVLGEPGAAEKVGVGQSFGLGYAGIYIGAAQRALDFFVEYVSSQRLTPDPAPLSHGVVVKRAVAQMQLALESARLVLYQSASKWMNQNPIHRAILAARAKYLATEAALMVTDKVMQMGGGRFAHKGLPPERIYRDVRTCTLMPPNVDRSLEIVGQAELGLDDELLSARYSS
ncbi:acyl-CoA dehydrogenase [SAR202 cluster bacterium AD-804-J14_MRT_500m]|nr:acyl-CoA dehydrogenase [SAR202 cluster bacterium AD-804-J14_MRT_500m]